MINLISTYLFDLPLFPTILAAILVYYLTTFYATVKKLPPGPFPIPFIGNLLYFAFNAIPNAISFNKWTAEYGEIFTVWIGSDPTIFVNSYELHYEATVTKRNDFILRPDSKLHDIIRAGHKNIFSTNGCYWEALRKVGHLASRKLAVNDNLPPVIGKVVDEATKLMLAEKQPFDPTPIVDLSIFNILATIAIGKRYAMDDQDFLKLKNINDSFHYLASKGLPQDFISILRPFYLHREAKMLDIYQDTLAILREVLFERKRLVESNYKRSVIAKDYMGSVLLARDEAIIEEAGIAVYLTDENLLRVVADLFTAGADTTQTLTRWMLLMLANHPEIQAKMYQEINDTIGDNVATQRDKDLLPFCYAFVQECLRLRPSAPLGLDHMTSCDTQLGGYKLPKNTKVMFNLYAQNNDPKFWADPQVLRPERFLEKDGSLIASKPQSLVSFGLGRRACPGEKLAMTKTFLVIVRFVQNLRFQLPTGPRSHDLAPDPAIISLTPRSYKIECISRK